MIWNDEKIAQWAEEHDGVTPYYPRNVNPASIDLSWSGRVIKAARAVEDKSNYYGMLDADQLIPDTWSEQSTVDSYALRPGEFYILDTLEYVKMPPDAAGLLFLKSSAGRMGIEHGHAGYIEPDFEGTISLEIQIVVPWRVTIQKGLRLVQLTFVQMIAPPKVSYKEVGRYSGQWGPTQSKGLPTNES